MSLLATDAHCHIGGANLNFEAAVCAINKTQWSELFVNDNPKIKRVFGLFLGEALTHSDSEIDSDIEVLKNFLSRADAIGEFGLDKRFVSVLPFYRQEKIFDAHISLVDDSHLPFVLHCVGAWGFLLKKIRMASKKAKLGNFLLHSAGCSLSLARDFESMGAYFSLSERQLNTRNGLGIASSVRIDRILLESDDIPSESTYLNVLGRLAQIRNISEDKLSEVIHNNFYQFYK